MKDSPYHAVPVHSLNEISAEEYASLLNRLDYPVQQTIEWYQSYTAHRKPNARFLEIRHRTTGALVGVVPLELRPLRGTRFWSHRKLFPLAEGPSDFCDFIFSPGAEKQISETVVEWLSRNAYGWDFLNWGPIPASSRSIQAVLDAFSGRGYQVSVDNSRLFYKIDTTLPWEIYEREFLKKKLTDLRNRMNRLIRMGIQLHVTTLNSDIENHLDPFFKLYELRRAKLSQKANYGQKEMKAFLVQVIRAYEKIGAVRLSLLQDQNGSIWAYQLDWLYGHTRYHYIPTFDEEYSSFSPGKLLLYETIKSSFEDPDIHQFNFMRGESPYKKQFADSIEGFIAFQIRNHNSLRLKATGLVTLIANSRDRVKASLLGMA